MAHRPPKRYGRILRAERAPYIYIDMLYKDKIGEELKEQLCLIRSVTLSARDRASNFNALSSSVLRLQLRHTDLTSALAFRHTSLSGKRTWLNPDDPRLPDFFHQTLEACSKTRGFNDQVEPLESVRKDIEIINANLRIAWSIYQGLCVAGNLCEAERETPRDFDKQNDSRVAVKSATPDTQFEH